MQHLYYFENPEESKVFEGITEKQYGHNLLLFGQKGLFSLIYSGEDVVGIKCNHGECRKEFFCSFSSA